MRRSSASASRPTDSILTNTSAARSGSPCTISRPAFFMNILLITRTEIGSATILICCMGITIPPMFPSENRPTEPGVFR